MRERTQLLAFYSAWLATLVTFPLAVAMVPVLSGLLNGHRDPVGFVSDVLGSTFYGYAVVWAIPTTGLGLPAWPLTKIMLKRTAGRRRAMGVLLMFGVLIGAAAGLVLTLALAVVPWVTMGLRDPVPLDAVVSNTVTSSATGFIWAAWFLFFVKLIGVNRPETVEQTAPHPGNS